MLREERAVLSVINNKPIASNSRVSPMINNKKTLKQGLLTVKEVAEHLNCKLSTIYAWAKMGMIPSYKVGGLLRFDPAEILEWINNSKAKTELPIRIIPQRPGSNDVDDLVQRAIASAKDQGYNVSKGKLGLDEAHKRGGS
jgi:excisionase family DNA binding protein